MKLYIITSVIVMLLLNFTFAHAAQKVPSESSSSRLKTAIFVQNHAGNNLHVYTDTLSEHLSVLLTGKGFSIIDKKIVMDKFAENREGDVATMKLIRALQQIANIGYSESSVQESLSGPSALRIAQMIGADYLVIASFTSLGTEKRTFIGEGTVYGTNNQTTIFNLKIALKVLERNKGGTVYGDIVTVSERISVGENIVISTTDIMPRLIETAANKLADNIAGKVSDIRNVKPAIEKTARFTVKSNVHGADVELDGAVIGSTPGSFTAALGVHLLRVTKQWLEPWERTVNIIPNHEFYVNLKLSPEGIQRYRTLERFKADIEIDKARAAKEDRRQQETKHSEMYERGQNTPASINTSIITH
jgi:hypothetical protein